MNLIAKTRDEMSKLRSRKMGDNIAIIEEFIKMNVYAVEIENYPQKSAYSCVTSLRQTCKSMNVGCTARAINGKPYLINEGVE